MRAGLTNVCGVEHAVEFGKVQAAKRAAKAVAAQKRAQAAETKIAKLSLKSLAWLCQDARKVIQKYCRLRDEAKYGICICCGIPRIDDGAHFFPVGSKYRTSRLSMNQKVISGACDRCNRFVGGGNIEGYKIGLVVRYGEGILEELEELKRRADHGEDAPLTREEVAAIKKDYAAKCRELLKQ